MTDLDRALHATVLKREAAKEREWREEREKREEEFRLGLGSTDMTKQELRKIIDSDRRLYYRTEELNDKLYIHYKGWKNLQNLEGWTGLRALYAECNAFDRIDGLQTCRGLRSLFLQENCIRRISGLENCPALWNLNLSSNFIEKIEGIAHLKELNTLIVAKNKIGINGVDDVVELLQTNVTTLDIQDNKLWDPDLVPEVFMRMGDLRVLYLKGNPCTKQIPNYRKSITVYCAELRYLDDRPVFPEDRRAAEAFNRGGLEEERAERRRIRQENDEKHERNMKAFNDMVQEARAVARERKAMRAEDKYTEENDPVESQERRMKRQVEEWREEHKEELKDDAKEYAEKCLRSEREQEGDHSSEAPAEPAEPSAATAEAPGTGSAVAGDVDSRKLVYEDIWDDVPASQEAQPARAAFAPPSRVGGGGGGDDADAGVFLPWASGAGVVGMESVAPAAEAVGLRAAELHSAEEQQKSEGMAPSAEEEPVEETGPSAEASGWYSKYMEKVQAAAATTPGDAAGLDEMD